MGFIEITAMRHRQKNNFYSACVWTQTEKKRKTKENADGRPVGARRSGVRWRGSNTWAPGSGPRIAFSKNLRGQGRIQDS